MFKRLKRRLKFTGIRSGYGCTSAIGGKGDFFVDGWKPGESDPNRGLEFKIRNC